MVVFLDYYRVTPVNREKLLATYDKERNYDLLTGMPLIISVEGTYVYVNDLTKLVKHKEQAYLVDKYIQMLKCREDLDITFKWYREGK